MRRAESTGARGFGLVELMITLVVLGVLTGISTVAYRSIAARTAESAASSALDFTQAGEDASYSSRGSFVEYDGADNGAALLSLFKRSDQVPHFISSATPAAEPQGGIQDISVAVGRTGVQVDGQTTSVQILGLSTMSSSGKCFLRLSYPPGLDVPSVNQDTASPAQCTGAQALTLASGTDPGAAATQAAVPSDFKAESGPGQVTLTWTPESSTAYTLTRTCLAGAGVNASTGCDQGSLGSGALRPSTAGSFTDTGLTGGATYVYSLYAQPLSTSSTLCSDTADAALRCSDPAGPVSATTLDISNSPAVPGVPGQVLNLAAQPGNTKLLLSWTAVAATPPVTDYRIAFQADGASSWTQYEDGTSSANGGLLTGLDNGTKYWVKVRAVNAAGSGPWSAAVSATPSGVPGAVTNLTANADLTDDSKLNLAWQAPIDAGASALTGYQVSYKVDTSATTWKYQSSASLASAYALTGLTGATKYNVRVRAKNSVGYGPWASATGTTLAAALPPGPVQNAALVAVLAVPADPDSPDAQLDRRLDASWDAPVVNATYGAATSYWVSYSTNAGGPWTDVDTVNKYSTTATSVRIQSLDDTQSYFVRIISHNAKGDGPAVITTQVSPKVTPGPIAWSNTSTVTGTGTTLANGVRALNMVWTAPTLTGPVGTPVIDYKVEYRLAGSATWLPVSKNITTLTQTINGTTPAANPLPQLMNSVTGQVYEVQVRARNQYGWGTAAVTRAGAPDAPTLSVKGKLLTTTTQTVQNIVTYSMNRNYLSGGAAYIDIYRRVNGTSAWTFLARTALSGGTTGTTHPFVTTGTYTDSTATFGVMYDYMGVGRAWSTATIGTYTYNTGTWGMPVNADGSVVTASPAYAWLWRGNAGITSNTGVPKIALTVVPKVGSYTGAFSTLSWTDPVAGPGVAKYQIYRSMIVNGVPSTFNILSSVEYPQATKANPFTTNSNTVTPFVPAQGGNVAKFYVAALNAAGDLVSISDQVSSAAVPNGPVTTISASRTDNVGVTWVPPTTAVGLPIHHYEIYYRAAGTANAWVRYQYQGTDVSYAPTATSATLVTQANFVPYFPQGSQWEVAVVAASEAGLSKGIAATTGALQSVPTYPPVVNNTKAGTTWNIGWTVPANNGGSPILGYKIDLYYYIGDTWVYQTSYTYASPATLSASLTVTAGSMGVSVLRAYTAIGNGDAITVINY